MILLESKFKILRKVRIGVTKACFCNKKYTALSKSISKPRHSGYDQNIFNDIFAMEKVLFIRFNQ